MTEIDHILLIGFGGPASEEEVRPFLKQVAHGRNIPEERLEKVARHYEEIGGKSPYLEQTLHTARELERILKEADQELPVYVGMRNWNPFLKETLACIRKDGCRRGLAILLSPFRSEASCRRYKQSLEQAKQETGAEELSYDYLEPWSEHPFFIQAHADKILSVLQEQDRMAEKNRFLFTAHSIPAAMNEECGFCRYEDEFRQSSTKVAQLLRLRDWTIAYQSRSGNPREPWLGPDIRECVTKAAEDNKEKVIVIPIGFFCDNAEILYDLDIEAGRLAARLGLKLIRTPAVFDHPKFIAMFGEMISLKRQAAFRE